MEVSADILGQKPQHEKAVLLEQGILAPVATVSLGVGEMLVSIQFYDHPRLRAQQIGLHIAPPVEGDRQLGIQSESARRVRQRLQPAVQERLCGTPRPIGGFGVGLHGSGGVNEQVRQRAIRIQ